MADEYDGCEPMPPKTLTLKEGEQVSVVVGNKTYRGALACDDGRWVVKSVTTGEEVLITRVD